MSISEQAISDPVRTAPRKPTCSLPASVFSLVPRLARRGVVLAAILIFGAAVITSGPTGRLSAQDVAPESTPDPELNCPAVPVGAGETPTFYIGAGDAQFARALYPAAAQTFSCALQLRPNDAALLTRRGYAYAAFGETERALADYEAALALDELYLPAYINRGAMYTRLGNFGLAINDLTLALSLEPDNVAALNNRAVVHAAEGNYDLALADIEAGLAIDAEMPSLYATRAAVYSALAARDYQQYIAVSDNDALPAGAPGEVLALVDDSLRTNDFSIWLSLLTSASVFGASGG